MQTVLVTTQISQNYLIRSITLYIDYISFTVHYINMSDHESITLKIKCNNLMNKRNIKCIKTLTITITQ